MNTLDAADRARCAELAIVPGRPFDLALRFIGAPAADRALALEALFSMLRELPWNVSDPAHGLAQLAWWQAEIAQAGKHGSQHPVVRALLATGVLSTLRGPVWMDYVQRLGEDLVDNVIPNQHALLNRLRETAGREAVLVSGLDQPGAWCSSIAARCLALLARVDSTGQAPAWVPLDLVARFDRAGNPAALVAGLAELALNWSAESPPGSARLPDSARLVLLQSLLARRLLQQLHDRPKSALGRGADRVGTMDVFRAWRWARRWPALVTMEQT